MTFWKTPFLTHEVGSLRKPKALISATANRSIPVEEYNEFLDFLSLIGVEKIPSELEKLLKEAGPNQQGNSDFHRQIEEWRVRLNIQYKESTGLDIIDVGEWVRREMYQHVVDNDVVEGIELLTHVRSFDYNYYRPGIYLGQVRYDDKRSIYLEEYEWAKNFATKPLKVCITAFNTVAEWTYQGKGHFEDILFDLVDEVFIPEVLKLLDHGVTWVQLDEPALTTFPDHVEWFTEAWNHFVGKIRHKLTPQTVLGLHNCFSDYSLLWPILPELDQLGAVTLEFANRDSWDLGTGAAQRNAFHEYQANIRDLYASGFKAASAYGVLPVHTDRITSPELIRDRLLYINDLVGDPRLVLGAPDCGLRQRSLETSHELLRNLVEGAKLAREEIG